MRYEWSLRRFWWGWFKQRWAARYYTIIHGIKMGSFTGGSILPKFGRGKFVSVLKKGSFIDIKAEQELHYKGVKIPEGAFIRLIPSAENHGIFYEYWKNGKLKGRLSLSMEDFVELMGEQNEKGLQDWAG